MDHLSSQEERDLISAVEQSIALANEGSTPNAAIQKIAAAKKYGPEKIRRMAEAFNKSKSVHVLKTASEADRAKDFALADVSEILRGIYAPQEKQAAAALAVPTGSFLDFDLSTMTEKTASAPLRLPDADTVERLEKQAAIETGYLRQSMDEQLRMTVQTHKYAFDQALDDVCRYMEPLPESAMRKIAQYITNGYPTTGKKLMAVISYKIARQIPDLQKSANTVVFPMREPYVSIAKVYDAAEKMARAEVALDEFRKTASEFGASLAANSLANIMTAAGLSHEKIPDMIAEDKKKEDSVEDRLDPVYYNDQKSQDTLRTFTMMSLYDRDLRQYPHKQLREAYNTAVGMAPDAYRNPVVLKNMMLRNLQTGDVKDPFEMSQELAIGDTLAKRRTAKDQERAQAEARKALLAKPVEKPSGTMGASGVLAAGGELAGSLKDIAKTRIGKMEESGKAEAKTQADAQAKARAQAEAAAAKRLDADYKFGLKNLGTSVNTNGGAPLLYETIRDIHQGRPPAVGDPGWNIAHAAGLI